MQKILILLICATGIAIAQKPLYENSAYALYPDKVVQGEWQAWTDNPDVLYSTYLPQSAKGLDRMIIFKFALNGLDNERPPFQDHRFLLPEDGRPVETPVYVFGEVHPEEPQAQPEPPHLPVSVNASEVTFRADMRKVLNSFRLSGSFTCYDGSVITADEFEGLYIAGGSYPLGWNFGNFAHHPGFELTDTDGDGIYTITVTFTHNRNWNMAANGAAVWRRSADLSGFPDFLSGIPLADAMYRLSLEEMLLDVQEDSTFMAGAKWPGVWTRDVSYSILLSLAALDPETSKRSLMAKVRDSIIIQDTGTGGAWPVSTDRMTWALAAWEIYLTTGDREWLSTAYTIIRNSATRDYITAYDHETGLYFGESSFLDWREQTYPRWMEPVDIFHSRALGTNMVHQRTWHILAEMAELLGEPSEEFRRMAEKTAEAINTRLWMDDKGYYGQYIQGRIYPLLSPRSETLGASLGILFDVTPRDNRRRLIENLPVLKFGPSCIYPQIPDIPPYHNNGIWPFVVAYYSWAAAKTGNTEATLYGISSIYRAAALFLTNKENMVGGTGDETGTEINSDRQLWSVAGNLAMVLRVYFGMTFAPEGIRFAPSVPEGFTSTKKLLGFKYRNATLDIEITGYGNHVTGFYIDDKKQVSPEYPADLSGPHRIRIELSPDRHTGHFNLVENRYSPETPAPKILGDRLVWENIRAADHYDLAVNTESIPGIRISHYPMANNPPVTLVYSLQAVGGDGLRSFYSRPEILVPEGTTIELPLPGSGSNGFIEITAEGSDVEIPVTIVEDGIYAVDFRYANGNGPINTNNKCALRSLYVNDHRAGVVVMPQRGLDKWKDWGYTNVIKVALRPGEYDFNLIYEEANENMNGEINSARISHLRLRFLREAGE